ncbi:3-deoxy-manno-octulosonate cytidylyltransferase family protein [Sphingomonas solaris]|uniref:3-deoxy-manno-octulosonate cytidylyltransferase n=1 Tax=Alterirhizorhabdus solaris TaxID=2529389 RepID=A0A558R3X2_9SPHN|nr:manno-octulosonate cytidylyltransferase [Sphingomonas solaris]TVV74047.1 3-deoxy-manno-octulosonate cytidylyltransferase [Sphingomonas solaris]
MTATAIVIPARYASTRYPAKPLALLRGAGGEAKSLIRRSWEAAMAVPGVDHVVVATDDDRIREAAEAFGARVVMTPETCANGTERCAAALAGLPDAVDIVVNLQGDAPLTPAAMVTGLIERLRGGEGAGVATPALRCAPELYRRLVADQKAGRVGGTTVVLNRAGEALYFSKRVIPYVPEDRMDEPGLPVFLHVGVYGYTRAALTAYPTLALSPLETLEGLEQLRFLDAGLPVAVVEAEAADLWELNNPADVPVIEAMLAARGIA